MSFLRIAVLDFHDQGRAGIKARKKAKSGIGGDPGIGKARVTWERRKKGGMEAERSKEKVSRWEWAGAEDGGAAPALVAQGLFLLTTY